MRNFWVIAATVLIASLASFLTASAFALPEGFEHAKSAKKIALPNEVRGLWCYWSSENGLSSYMHPNDEGAGCGDGHDWIVIAADGSYHGFEDGCRAAKAFVISHGVTIKGTPGAYAAYGVISHCKGEGGTRNESARIDVHRWGDMITIGTVTTGSR